MKRAIAVLPAVAAVTLALAPSAVGALPKPKDTRIVVPKAIAGIELKMKIKKANRDWGRRGDCDFKGFGVCTYEGRGRRSGSASIEAARRGNVSSVEIEAGTDKHDEYVFKGRLRRIETKEGIGLGDRGAKVPKAYPKAIRTANKTGYIVEGKGRSYMTFRTLDGKHITGISLVDGKHQG
jgi:hypothetical protein